MYTVESGSQNSLNPSAASFLLRNARWDGSLRSIRFSGVTAVIGCLADDGEVDTQLPIKTAKLINTAMDELVFRLNSILSTFIRDLNLVISAC